jgi:hypothetical protein
MFYVSQKKYEMDGCADAIIIDASNGGNLSLEELSDVLSKLLSGAHNDEVEVGIHFYNSWSYQLPLLRGIDSAIPRYSFPAIKKMLVRAGFVHQRIYSHYPDERRVVDVTPSGHKTVFNQEGTVRERLKIRILQNHFLRYFQPAYIVVASKSYGTHNNVIDSIVHHENFGSLYHLFLGSTNILIAVFKHVIVHVPMNVISIARCKQNKRILLELKKTKFGSYTPLFINESSVNNQIYFCESKMPGASSNLSSMPAHKIDLITNNALRFITEFHKDSLKDMVVNENNFKRQFSRNFKRIEIHLNKEYATKLAGIAENLKKRLNNKNMKSVWMHGDYKIENILFDTKNWNIDGVIDWDMSRREGVPLVDLLCILLCKAERQSGQSMESIYRQRYVHLKFTPEEMKIIVCYLETLGISIELLLPLTLAYWIEAAAKHIVYTADDGTHHTHEWMHKRVYCVIDEIMKVLM